MADSRAAEKLAIRAELAAARNAVTAQVHALTREAQARATIWRATVASPVKILLTMAGGWLAYRALKKRRMPIVSIGWLAVRWLRPRLTAWLHQRQAAKSEG